MEVLKIEVLDLGPNFLFLGEELRVGSSLTIIWYCARGEVYGSNVSQPVLLILMWDFSHSLDI